MLGFLIPGWLKLIPLAILGAALVAGFLYIKSVIADNAQLKANQAVFEVALAQQKVALSALGQAVA